jgi:imidazole glycerol-phosphate synthase subunit HisH
VSADVVVIDSGGANLASLLYALRRLEVNAEVSTDAARIGRATHVLLPGVGAAPDAMARLRASGIDTLLPRLTQPVLGICLGMQLLFDSSAEAAAGETETRCLSIVPGHVAKMPVRQGLPVPHMGWNQLEALQQDPLFDGINAGEHVYFVHSFAAPLGSDTLASCDYGGPFTAAVRRGNFRGVQFHPERSAGVGARLLRNFVTLVG